MISISIQTSPFNLVDEEAAIRNSSEDVGALVIFQGMVRGKDQQIPLSHLFLEHYPQVTEQEITRIINEAKLRWQFASCRVIHRVGKLLVGEPIVLVIVTATHRKQAFLAAEFIMDYLKTEAPFWKKEYFIDNSEQWVIAKITDEEQKMRWQ